MQRGSVNKVILVGHLGNVPESRYTPAGSAVANFNLATNETWRSSEGNNEEHTEWHRCILFGKLAERAKEYLQKGQMIYLEGRLRTRSWEDKDGVKRYTTEIIGDNFTMLGRKGNDMSSNDEIASENNDDDLPF